MAISKDILNKLKKASWIRKMFEEGIILKQKYGASNVFDFSLGNPDVSPPEEFFSTLEKVASERIPGIHGYMTNSGYPEARERVAKFLGKEFGIDFGVNNIIMVTGAAGGLNVVLKALLDPGDEVIVFKPYFVEYMFYVGNHNGVLVEVETDEKFFPDFIELEQKITERTKAVIVNTPNNPTGAVYDKNILKRLADILETKSKQYNKTIYLLSDEPYRYIYYGDGKRALSPIEFYKNSIMISSHSKDLSIPGERIGFIAIHPENDAASDLYDGCTFTNRILGFVNAPALMQRVTTQILGTTVDVSIYKRRRDILCEGLKKAGYEFNVPLGAFYLFPKSPIPDDVEFCKMALEEKILITPGSGFMRKGYFRISYCVSENTIIKALPGFKRLIERVS